jgi:hypothetical protein
VHTHTHTHTHARFEFDEIPELDKEEFAEWLEGIRSAEEEQEQEQLEQQQAQELAQETEQQGQNSMDMQRSGSDRGEDTEGGVFEEHISSSRKLAISGTSATVAHSEGEEITVIYRNRGKLWTVP